MLDRFTTRCVEAASESLESPWRVTNVVPSQETTCTINRTYFMVLVDKFRNDVDFTGSRWSLDDAERLESFAKRIRDHYFDLDEFVHTED